MMDYSIEDRGYLWLSLVDSMPIIKKYEMLEVAGGIVELFTHFADYSSDIIRIAGNNNFAKLNYYLQSDVLDGEIDKINKANIEIVAIDSEYYPVELKNIDTPPLLLYVMGNKEVLNDKNTLAVVGTRAPSRTGKDATKFLVRGVAKCGITIVSGLARGVDKISHSVALEEDGVTIGVVANGLDICYPAENRDIRDRMCEKGAVISEYPLGATPFAYRFPERNRIISGLSKGVLVTEAGRNSGSLITLNLALEQGKNVYIAPGPINTPSYFGSNDMIKELQGAIVTDPIDILKDYDIKVSEEEQKEDIPLSEFEAKLVEYITREQRHIDEISAFAGDMNINSLLATLSKLELYGLIERLPGNYYGK